VLLGYVNAQGTASRLPRTVCIATLPQKVRQSREVLAVTETEARLETLAIWLGLLLLVGWRLGALGGAKRARRAARRFARRAGLPADSQPVLARRVVRRQRFVLAGISVGLAVGSWLDQLWFAALYGGLAVGAVVDRLTQPVAPPGAPRVAHATATGVTDYVPRWLLGAVVAAAAMVLALAGLWVIAPRTERGLGGDTPATIVLLLVAATTVALAASLCLARVVVHRRATVGSPLELATDDALRAQAVRDALHLSAAVSVVAAFALSLALQEPDVDGVLRRVGGWLPAATLVLLLAVGKVHEWSGPRHWRSRLHPELGRPSVRA
jgi:hypothetical protein